jgi:hypothetical protein
MRKILDALPQSVGFTLDVGHAMIYHGNPIEYIDILADRLCHLHLHDNLGGNSEMFHDLALATRVWTCRMGWRFEERLSGPVSVEPPRSSACRVWTGLRAGLKHELSLFRASKIPREATGC